MNVPPGETVKSSPGAAESLLRHALLLDIEVSQRGRIIKLGAAVGDSILSMPDTAHLDSLLDALSEFAS